MELLSKLKNKHFLSLAGNAIMSVFGLVIAAVLYRALPVEELGVWVFFQSTLLLIDTFRSGFLTTAFIKFYAGAEKNRAAEIMGSSWYLGLAITCIFIVLNIPALFFLDKIENQGLLFFFKWFAVTYICTLPSFMASCVVQAQQRFDRLLYIRFVSQVLFILGIVLLIVTGKNNLQNIIYANLAAALLTSLFTFAAGYSGIRDFRYRTKKGIKEMFHFGKYSVGTTLGSNLFRSSDTFIINFLLGPAALAIYNLGQRLMEIVEIPLRSFAATAMPALSAAYNQDKRNEVIYVMKKYTGMLTVALVPVALVAVLLADVAVGLIGGGKYVGTEAANVFRLFMTFALLFPADRFLALTLDVIHQPKINFYKVLIMLAANIAGDFIGIHLLGNIYGVAITTVIPIIIGVLIGYFALRRYLPFSMWNIYQVGYAELRLLVRQFLRRPVSRD
ncbi:oligosaccharide flippase family protein [Sediminibacterium ginsengisoli]|uniref:Membrane protein involved in the export of O-antigen and teichoic acid n=1 Tax=Sediminibacterium ginsengisoli TaxID=413434 RepID=A0A1T4RM42_9BACT|nr:oligosaccharide flippase family protein [Sediminibacterium ginsengisoli]SKA17042.1 Membrane protein involved in the export of O-antigen and teichoic acid [Sediminibacterium ginsengisoli]